MPTDLVAERLVRVPGADEPNSGHERLEAAARPDATMPIRRDVTTASCHCDVTDDVIADVEYGGGVARRADGRGHGAGDDGARRRRGGGGRRGR